MRKEKAYKALTTTAAFIFFINISLMVVSQAQAHRANVFAYEDSGTIKVETSFSGGRPAMNAPIEVFDDATGAKLADAVTDAQGLCSFPIPEAARQGRLDMRIALTAGEGHRGEWIIKADEYLGAAGDASPAAAPQAAAPTPASVETTPAGAAVGVDEAALKRIVAEAVNHELAPLRRSLAAMSEPGPSTRDIFGGIGYILGLFGIAAWTRSRKAGA